MRPEDDDEPGSGPPPDPSLRAWRHPSEIAAAAAAAARFSAEPPSPPPVPPPPSPASGLLVVAGAVLAVAGLMAVGLALGLDTRPATLSAGADERVAARLEARGLLTSDLRPPPVVSTMTLTNRSGPGPNSSGRGSGGTGPADNSDNSPGSANATATTTPETATTVTTQTAETDPGGYRNSAPVDQRVTAVINGTTIRLAAFTVVDGMMFTAASAVAGHDPLTVTFGDFSATAQLAGIDPVSDLALLTIGDDEMSALTAALESAPTRQTTIQADVIGHEQVTKLATGQRVYGTLLTAAMRPPGCGGAPLTDSAGTVVGMILHTNAALVSALPVERLVEVGRTLSTWNLASLAWLGIDGSSSPRGGAELTSVSSDGPAAAAGAQQGDRIVAFDGIEVQDWHHLIHLIRAGGPDTPVSLVIERDGGTVAVTVTIGSRLEQVAIG